MAKTSEAGVVKYNTESGEVRLSQGIIRKYLVSGRGNVTDQEVMMFLTLCKYQGLNPFLREAYLIKYSDSQAAACVVGKEVFTQRAAKHTQFDGFSAGVYVKDSDGKLIKRTGSLTLDGEELVGGWAEVNRKDWGTAIESAVSFEEYKGKTKEGNLNRQWERMPATMIRKVALVQALREAFPKEFAGMVDSAEVDTGGVDLSTAEVKVDASIIEEDSAYPPTNESEGTFDGSPDDPNYIPRSEPVEEDPEADLQGTAKQCRDAVKLLAKQKYITDDEMVQYEIEITDKLKAKDLKGLAARYEKLRNLYMEIVQKKAAGLKE